MYPKVPANEWLLAFIESERAETSRHPRQCEDTIEHHSVPPFTLNSHGFLEKHAAPHPATLRTAAGP